MNHDFIAVLGFLSAVILPLWNIPLIVRIIKRKSSSDISLWWTLGVWICLLLLAPSGLRSPDPIWRIFNILNLILFTGVIAVVFIYRKGR